jgi:16S rRNA (guanine527-N7)-methyltransferase
MAGEFGPRLAGRASEFGLTLSQPQLAQLEAYVRLLERWNTRINLTALHLHPLSDHALDRLLLEPLVAAKHVADSAISWIDLGSGGGSPAIPLKILRPRLRLTMVESVGKKAAFLREAVRTLALADVDVELGERRVGGAHELASAGASTAASSSPGMGSTSTRPGQGFTTRDSNG